MNHIQNHGEYRVNRQWGGEIVDAREVEKCIDDFGTDIYFA